MKAIRFALSLLFLIVPNFIRAQIPTTAPLQFIQAIPIPDGGAQIGHMSADAERGILYVANLGGNSVDILDLRTGRATVAIANVMQPQDVLYERISKRLFVASGADGTCKVFDPATSYSLLASIPLGGNVSHIEYAPAYRQVVVGYGAGTLGLIDTQSLNKVGEIGLSGHPEGFQLELNSPRAFVNIPDAKHVTVVDRMRREIIDSWPLGNLSQNYPMAQDEAHQRLFVGCRTPAMMQIYESSGGGAITQFGIGDDAGDISYDAAHGCLYVSCGQGVLDVIRQLTPDTYRLELVLATGIGARTSLYVPELNRLYVAVPRQGNRVAAVMVFRPVPRVP